MIAIPLGMSVGVLTAPALAPLIGFALGAFPINEINKLLRRLAARALNDAEAANDQDDLLKMLGVTPDVSSQLNDEGLYSPQQLVDTDPVSLALRTGLPFDFVVNLISQSQVWSYLGATADKLAPYGYGDARMIKRLVDKIGQGDTAAISSRRSLAQALGLDEALLTSVFEAISLDPYTLFLVGIS